jgi:hypothetical protein
MRLCLLFLGVRICLIIRLFFPAMCFRSLDFSKKPVLSSLIMSSMAPTGVAKTSVPQAMASSMTEG